LFSTFKGGGWGSGGFSTPVSLACPVVVHIYEEEEQEEQEQDICVVKYNDV